jgi:hypothetical protein
MKITICDWLGGTLLQGTKFSHGQVLEGTESEALAIASDLFKHGRNIMVTHSSEGFSIFVDNKRFQQR